MILSRYIIYPFLSLRYNQPHIDDEQELGDYKDDENIGTSGKLK